MSGPATQPMRVGMIGCGNISKQYLSNLAVLPGLRLVAVADAVAAAAERVAAEQHVPVLGVDELIGSAEVDVVLNLTTPAGHAPLTIAALQAGKHVYQEKPFSVTLAEADAMMAAMQASGRRFGSAPDTVLGTGIQTARRLVDDGEIGEPVAASAFMLCPGHEAWHPNPGFYYLAGGGPLLDMGVYYLTALVTLLGPVVEVSGMASRQRTERVVPDDAPRAGEVLPVEVDTHVAATLRHANGAISTLVVSFDVTATTLPPIEVYGSRGSLLVPDPNQFTNTVGISHARRDPFTDVADLGGYADAGRGFGLADLARAVQTDEPHRQSAELGYHVNEIMVRIVEATDSGRTVRLASTCERPAAVPAGAAPDQS